MIMITEDDVQTLIKGLGVGWRRAETVLRDSDYSDKEAERDCTVIEAALKSIGAPLP